MKAPIADKKRKALEIHNDIRNDNYFWMNQREDPEVINYLHDENKYTETVLQDVSELRESLYNEMVGRIKQNDETVPYKIRGYFYYSRFENGKEYPIYCRKKGSMDIGIQEEILLDVNIIAKGHSYCDVSELSISPDNNLMAFGLDTLSRRLYTIYIKNLVTGELYPYSIPNASGETIWANDNKTIFYVGKNTETLREEVVMKHVLSTSESIDKKIFFEQDETFVVSIHKTKSEKFLMIASSNTLSDEYQFLDADTPDKTFTLLQKRERNLEYDADHYGDKFYIRTNLHASNFRLMETPVDKPSKENWKEVLTYHPEVFLDNFEIFKNFLVLGERKNALNQLRVINWESKNEYYIDFEEKAYYAEIDFNPDFDSEVLRFQYSSLTTPTSIIDYSLISGERKIMKRQEVLGDFDIDNYISERLFATANDGSQIPISLVYRKDFAPNGKNPLLLYGYGSYGISIDPYFSSSRLSLLDRGFCYAIAHIRGGEDLGRHWYEDGKLLKKKNTFTDFINCGEYLIQQKYVNPQKLYAMGGSAGGLLIGCVVNLRPDLFNGVIADVPFVDVVTTMLDDTIPLTTGEYDEWGNPGQKEYYEYMLSYSPYDNVTAKNYPNMLVVTGLHDSQVQYWEPAKWVAKLRDMKTDNNILLLNTNMEAGHGGASGRFERYKDIAREFAFLLKLEWIYK